MLIFRPCFYCDSESAIHQISTSVDLPWDSPQAWKCKRTAGKPTISSPKLIDRTWERLKEHTPPDQAAYQPGRGTTEQVFAIKLLAEEAISSIDYQIYLLLFVRHVKSL